MLPFPRPYHTIRVIIITFFLWRGPDGNCNPISIHRGDTTVTVTVNLIPQNGPAVTVICFSYSCFSFLLTSSHLYLSSFSLLLSCRSSSLSSSLFSLFFSCLLLFRLLFLCLLFLCLLSLSLSVSVCLCLSLSPSCVVVVLLLLCCGVHAEKPRVSIQNVSVCTFKTSPSVPAPRAHVFQHVRGAGTHGDVLTAHTGTFRTYTRGARGGSSPVLLCKILPT